MKQGEVAMETMRSGKLCFAEWEGLRYKRRAGKVPKRGNGVTTGAKHMWIAVSSLVQIEQS